MPKKTHDYTITDDMLSKGASVPEIVARTGIPYNTITWRRRELRLAGRVIEPQQDQYHDVPLIPPAERPRMALEATRERLGMDEATFKRVWMTGSEAQRTAEYWGCSL